MSASDGIPRKCCHLDLLTKFNGLNFTPEAPPKPGLSQKHTSVDLSSKSSPGFNGAEGLSQWISSFLLKILPISTGCNNLQLEKSALPCPCIY